MASARAKASYDDPPGRPGRRTPRTVGQDDSLPLRPLRGRCLNRPWVLGWCAPEGFREGVSGTTRSPEGLGVERKRGGLGGGGWWVEGGRKERPGPCPRPGAPGARLGTGPEFGWADSCRFRASLPS